MIWRSASRSFRLLCKPPTARVLKWRETFGRDQTEIDAMIELRPRELGNLIVDAMKPFLDDTLHDRVRDAKYEYLEKAREWIDE